jgi:hypothetical protein
MSRQPYLAFTLLELLVATALGVGMLALAAGSLLHVRNTAAVTTEILAMHDASAAVYRILVERLESQMPTGAWHLTADPGAGGWGTGDESCELTFLASMARREERDGGYAAYDMTANDWFRLRWDGAQRRLTWSRTAGRRTAEFDTAGGFNYNRKVAIHPQPRRDRRRELDDNDLRYVEGMTNAQWQKFQDAGLRGDESSLDAGHRSLLPSTLPVSNFAIAWIDREGYETRFDPALGIVRQDAAGNATALPSTAWANDPAGVLRASLDGVFVDARQHTSPVDTRDTGTARPAVLRLSYELKREAIPGLRSREPIALTFTYAFRLQPSLPLPALDWPLGMLP